MWVVVILSPPSPMVLHTAGSTLALPRHSHSASRWSLGIELPACFCPESSLPHLMCHHPSYFSRDWCHCLLYSTLHSASPGALRQLLFQCCPIPLAFKSLGVPGS